MSETCRVIINQVKQKLHLVGYLPIQYKDVRYQEHKNKKRCSVVVTDKMVLCNVTVYVHLLFMWDIPVCGEYELVQTVVHSSSYLYRICKPDDGSHEPKHVAPCSLLFLINNSILYFIVCD